jgi:hypothetical protein
MTRKSIRTVAAALAVVVTACGLKGIGALAHVDAYAGFPLVTLPRVEVIASKPEIERHVATDSTSTRRRM